MVDECGGHFGLVDSGEVIMLFLALHKILHSEHRIQLYKKIYIDVYSGEARKTCKILSEELSYTHFIKYKQRSETWLAGV